MKILRKAVSLLLICALLAGSWISAADEVPVEAAFSVTRLRLYDEENHQIVDSDLAEIEEGQIVAATVAVVNGSAAAIQAAGFEGYLLYNSRVLEPYSGDEGDTEQTGPFYGGGFSSLSVLGFQSVDPGEGSASVSSTAQRTLNLDPGATVELGLVAFRVKPEQEEMVFPLRFDQGGQITTVTDVLDAGVGDPLRVSVKGTPVKLADVSLEEGQVTVDGTEDQTVGISALSSTGNEIAQGLTWSVIGVNGGRGVSVSETGFGYQVNISAKAKADDYRVIARDSSGVAIESMLTVLRMDPVLTSLKLSAYEVKQDGPVFYEVKAGEAGTVTCSPLDQYDDPVDSVELLLSPTSDEMTFTGNRINITANQETGEFEVSAIKGDKTIVVNLHVVEELTPPPTPTKVEVAFPIDMPANTEVQIPGSDEDDRRFRPFTAYVTDEYGHDMPDEKVTWSVSPGIKGVNIDVSTGVLTVTKEAKADVAASAVRELSIIATASNGVRNEAPVTIRVLRAASRLTELVLDKYEAEAGVDHSVGAKGLDQYGGELRGFQLSSDKPERGVTCTEYTVNIAESARGGDYVITASMPSSTGDSVQTAQKTLTVRRTAQVGRLNILPPLSQTIIVPPDGQDNTASDPFVAEVLDTYDVEMDDVTVTWSIPSTEGVWITSDGTVHVSNEAKNAVTDNEGITLKVTAALDSGLTNETASVTIRRQNPAPAAIKIYYNDEEVTGPESFGIPGTKTYTTQVVDQYGTPVAAIAGRLELAAPVQGVSVDGFTVRVSEDAADGTQALLRAVYGNLPPTNVVMTAQKLEVQWPDAHAITYGQTKAEAFDAELGSGTALYDGKEVSGRFEIAAPEEILSAGERNITLLFTGEVNGSTLSMEHVCPVTVNKAPLTIPAQSTLNRFYDGKTDFTMTVPPQGLVNGDSFNITLSASIEKKTGEQVIPSSRVTVQADSPAASNYETPVLSSNLRLMIAKRPVTINGISATSRPFDGTTAVELTGGQLRDTVSGGGLLSSVIPGDDVGFELGSGTMADANVGTNKPVTVNVRLTGADAENYELSTPDQITVNIYPNNSLVVEVSSAPPVNTGEIADPVLKNVDYQRTRIPELVENPESAAYQQVYEKVQALETDEDITAVLSLVVKPVSYTNSASSSGHLTLDISVHYDLQDASGETLESGELDRLDRPVTVTVDIPRTFQPNLVRHTKQDGTVELIVPDAPQDVPGTGYRTVSWQQQSFSPVELVENASLVTFLYADGTEKLESYDPAAMGTNVQVTDTTRTGGASRTWEAVAPEELAGQRYTRIEELVAAADGAHVTVKSVPDDNTSNPPDNPNPPDLPNPPSPPSGDTGRVIYVNQLGQTVDDRVYSDGNAEALLPVLNVDGYTFNGWTFGSVMAGTFRQMSQTLLNAILGKTVSASPSLTANTTTPPDEPQTGTILFLQQDERTTYDSRTYSSDSLNTALPTLSVDGYTFNGWTFGNALPGTFTTLNQTLLDAVLGGALTATPSLTANTPVEPPKSDGEPKTGTIVFARQDGTTLETRTYSQTDLNSALPTLSVDGYTFNGWTFGSTASGTFRTLNQTLLNAVLGTTLNASPSLTANTPVEPPKSDGEPKTGTIVFMRSDGRTTLETHAYSQTDLNSALPTLSADGYTFNGWTFGSAVSGTFRTLNQTLLNAVLGKTLSATPSLTANTTPNPPASDGKSGTITFLNQSGQTYEVHVYSDGSVSAPLPILSVSGYTFNGWTFGSVISGAFRQMSQTLLDAIDGKSVTASPSLTYINSGYSGGGGGSSSSSSSGGGGGGSSSGSRYSVTASSAVNGTISASPTSAYRGDTVTLTVTPKEGYVVSSVDVRDRNGNTISTTQQSNGTYTFTMPATSVTITPTFAAASETVPSSSGSTNEGQSSQGQSSQGQQTQPQSNAANPFVDVYATGVMAPFYNAIQWAYQNRITGGTTATTFSPYETCSRAQAMTFLWRAMGSPEPETTESPFVDVQPGGYFYKAVLWAVEQKITNGTTAYTFSPDQTVTRSQVVTFLYRNSGEVSVTADNPFTDVDRSSYYGSAVLWAVSRGITNGMTPTTFAPFENCTRAQIVTFIYRYVNN